MFRKRSTEIIKSLIQYDLIVTQTFKEGEYNSLKMER